MKFGDFKIGTRLALSFSLVVLLSVASAGLALKELAMIEHILDDIVTDNNAKIRRNHEMAEAVHIVSRVMREMVLVSDEAQVRAEEAKLLKARALYDHGWDELQKFPASETGKANRARIAADAKAAQGLNNEVIALAHANKDEEAIAMMLSLAGPATQKWQDSIDENIAFQEANTVKQYESAVSDYNQARAVLIGANLLCIALAALLGWRVSRSITREMGGELADAVGLARAVSAGDLSGRVDLRTGDDSSLMAHLRVMQIDLAKVVAGLRGNAESVAVAGVQIAQGNSDLTTRSEQQASAIEETAASMEELSVTVKQNADNAKQANQLAMGASMLAGQGGEAFGQVVQTMKGINDSSKRIADIVSVIDGIAFQTNILALNAAVEAARAGEQGRGFAVVASEVRSLAGRSANAAKEIKGLITASVERVEQGTVLVNKAGSTMTEVVNSIKQVTDIMGEISAASTEQSIGVAQVGEAISHIDRATQQNVSLVEQGAAAAESLKTQSRQLVQAVEAFKLQPADTVRHVAPALAPLAAVAQRRGPDLAKTMSRSVVGTKVHTKYAQVEKASVTAADEWTSF